MKMNQGSPNHIQPTYLLIKNQPLINRLPSLLQATVETTISPNATKFL